ncbi:MAG: ATPase, T2SS/T4P/T4SS family, partial [Phenylobacterium sp.]
MGRFSLSRDAAAKAEPVEVADAGAAKPKAAQAPAAARPAPAPRGPEPKPKSAGSAAPKSDPLDIRLRLHARLIDELDLAKLDKLDETELRREVMHLVADFARAERMALNTAELTELGASIYDEMVGLGPIEPLLKDDSINDILINGPFQIYVERRGELELTPVKFRDNDHLLRIVNRIVAAVGRRIDESQPMVDARLPDGSRV